MSTLNPKQARFVAEYLIDLNATQAAIRAGYSPGTPSGGRFYVYCLVDPRDGRPFYVGKGTGNRIKSHVRNAAQGIIDNAPKHERILQILAAGLSVSEVKVLDGLAEPEAFDIERELIRAIPGLCNISQGSMSNERRRAVVARDLLARMKSYEEWVASTSPDRVEQGARFFGLGSPHRCYNRFVEVLSEIAAGGASC